jgi:hypothetical protein
MHLATGHSLKCGRLSSHFGHAKTHGEIGFVQAAEIKPTRIERIVASLGFPADPAAQHGHKDKMHRHGAIRSVIEGIDRREHAACLPADGRFLKEFPLGGSFNGLPEFDFAARKAPPAGIRWIPAPHQQDPAAMKDHRDGRHDGPRRSGRGLTHALGLVDQ